MIVLGPVPCQGCRRSVVYAPSCHHDGRHLDHGALRWLDADTTRLHRCEGSNVRAICDNGRVGISDATSPDIMCDALLVADTSREGVPRLEVSAPMTFDGR